MFMFIYIYIPTKQLYYKIIYSGFTYVYRIWFKYNADEIEREREREWEKERESALIACVGMCMCYNARDRFGEELSTSKFIEGKNDRNTLVYVITTGVVVEERSSESGTNIYCLPVLINLRFEISTVYKYAFPFYFSKCRPLKANRLHIYYKCILYTRTIL